jgi:hypothetical protein
LPNTLRQAWETYTVLTIPPSISDDALEAQRRAFYAGAVALWGVFEQADANGEPEPVVLLRVRREMEEGPTEKGAGNRGKYRR